MTKKYKKSTKRQRLFDGVKRSTKFRIIPKKKSRSKNRDADYFLKKKKPEKKNRDGGGSLTKETLEDTETRQIRILLESNKRHIQFIQSIRSDNLHLYHRFDLNFRDYYGKTALIWACINDNYEVVTQLIKAGVDINIQDNDGNTALMFAVLNNSRNENMIRILIESGADLKLQDNNGNTALLDSLLKENNLNVLKLLIKGSNLNVKNHEGDTPLMKAVKLDRRSYIFLLLMEGADDTIVNNMGITPRRQALIENRPYRLERIWEKAKSINFTLFCLSAQKTTNLELFPELLRDCYDTIDDSSIFRTVFSFLMGVDYHDINNINNDFDETLYCFIDTYSDVYRNFLENITNALDSRPPTERTNVPLDFFIEYINQDERRRGQSLMNQEKADAFMKVIVYDCLYILYDDEHRLVTSNPVRYFLGTEEEEEEEVS